MPTSQPDASPSQSTTRSARDRVDDVLATAATLGLRVELSVSGNLQHMPAHIVDEMVVTLDAALSAVLRRTHPASVDVVVTADGQSVDLQVGSGATRSVDEVVDWRAEF